MKNQLFVGLRFDSLFIKIGHLCWLWILPVLIHAQDAPSWKFKTNGRIYASPVLGDEYLYFGSGDSVFYCLNKDSGDKIWEFKTGGKVHSSPVLSNTKVIFGSGDGYLYALDQKTGSIRWKFASQGERKYGLWDYYLSSPRLKNEFLFWGSGDGNLYVLNEHDGSLKWKHGSENIIHASPSFDEQNVYIGGFDGFLYSLDQENGNLNWKFKTVGATFFPNGEIQRSALISDGVAYFGSRDYNLYAIDTKSGRGRWNMKQPSGWIIATPSEYKDNIYFGTSDAHLFYCLNKKTGEVIWTLPINMRVYGSAAFYNDMVFFGCFNGKLYGVDYLTGEVKWEFQTEGCRKNYYTIYDENDTFRDDFELYTANYIKAENQIHTLGSILCTPVIDNGHIFFGSSDGNMYAVKLPEKK